MTFLAFNILQSGVTLSMVCAAVGLAFAFFLIKAVIRLSPGNERMRQIAGAIEEGAKAYLARQVGQMAQLIDSLLEVSRITRGKVQLHKETLDVGGLVARVVETVRPLVAYDPAFVGRAVYPPETFGIAY